MKVNVSFGGRDPYLGAPEGYIKLDSETLFRIEGEEGTYEDQRDLIDRALKIEEVKLDDKTRIVMSRL